MTLTTLESVKLFQASVHNYIATYPVRKQDKKKIEKFADEAQIEILKWELSLNEK